MGRRNSHPSSLIPHPSSFRGSALVFSLFILFFMGTVMMASLSLFTAQVEAMSREHSRTVAFHLAEGGVDWAMAKLTGNRGYRGEAEVPLGDGSFSVSVVGKGDRFTVESTGAVSALRGTITRGVRVHCHFAGLRPIVDMWEETPL